MSIALRFEEPLHLQAVHDRDEGGCRVAPAPARRCCFPTPRPARRRSSPAGCGTGPGSSRARGARRSRTRPRAPSTPARRRAGSVFSSTVSTEVLQERGPLGLRPGRHAGDLLAVAVLQHRDEQAPPCCRSDAARPRGSCPPARRPRRGALVVTAGAEHVHRRLQHGLATLRRARLRALHAFGGGPAARIVSRCVHHGCSLPERLAAAASAALPDGPDDARRVESSTRDAGRVPG